MSVALWCIFDNLTVYFFSADIFLFFGLFQLYGRPEKLKTLWRTENYK